MNNIDINPCTIQDLRKCVSNLIVENAKLKKDNSLLADTISDLECMLMCKQHQYLEVMKNAK